MIYVLPVDEWGCGYYRLIWPVQVLKHMGHQVKMIQPGKHKFFLSKNNNIMIPPDTELVVMQRPANVFHTLLIEALDKHGIPVVVDMDDDISTIHPSNLAHNFYRHSPDKMHSWKHTMSACKAATLLTVSAPALLDAYGARGRGVVLPNYVPSAYLQLSQHHVKTFGWAGNTFSHYNDLNVLTPAVQDLVDEGYEFRVVGGDRRTREALRLRETPFMTGGVPVLEWAQKISEHIGVGLVPLAATQFNTGKSWLKGIEYMAVGKPWVASPREEYRRLQRASGCGFLVDTPKQWYATVKQLLDDENLYHEHATRGFAYMQGQTYELNAWRWAEAWDHAISLQRGRMM